MQEADGNKMGEVSNSLTDAVEAVSHRHRLVRDLTALKVTSCHVKINI